MDLKGNLINQLKDLPPHWWIWLIAVSSIDALINFHMMRIKHESLSIKNLCIRPLFMAYVVFILLMTILGRRQGEQEIILTPFLSYFNHSQYMQILFNYLLFFPFGFLLRFISEKNIFSICAKGLIFSLSIELFQLLFRIGTFEFDDVFGNTIGCMLGGLLGKVLLNGIRSYRDYCK